MTQPSYKHPPITEAVIEISFAMPMDSSEVDKVSNKFRSHYPQNQKVQNVKVAVRLPAGQKETPKAKFNREAGHRRSSSDMTELLVLWRSAFVVSQLAPYPGWDAFFQRFVRDWKVWKRVMGFQPIGRLGVRYINRIDLPLSGHVVEHETFLNVYPKLPDILGPVGAYAVQAVLPIEDIGCRLTLNSAVVPAPILGHASFVIDQDIAKEVDLPQSDEAIYELLNEIRVRKNNVFEACISDRARELFQR
ncbi:MAG: TIGR04255 family protein [Betaproteobacteria bacterium]|nr:TIGR04255 family protein [Betaproteobacteria bacterium]